ncbi:MAG TPA: ABC transporter substrate-binding protein [Firmicutes bacterium]|nr:ABC transporter substrate-binding protein [Bacillota bacterium]
MKGLKLTVLLILLTMVFGLASYAGAAPIEVRFLFPVQTAGPLAVAMEEIVDEFNRANPDIMVNAIFTGNYAATNDRIRTTTLAGNPPHVALTEMVQAIALDELNAVVDLTPYIEAEGPDFYDDFIDGFWRGFQLEGKILGLPFQHSIPLAYYNLDALAEAGLDPSNPPTTWDETKKAAQALVAHDPSRLAIVSPADAWILQGFVESNSGSYIKDLETPTFNDAKVIEALQFFYDMIHTWNLLHVRSYGEASEDFLAGDAAIMYNSTGSMAFVRDNAYFNWSVGPLPRNTVHSFPYGGGGLYLFKGHSAEEEAAAWRFMKYLTSPEITARWSRTSGYFAVRKSAYELPEMQAYFQQFPQAKQAADLLQYTNKQWILRRYAEASQLTNSIFEAILVLGEKTPAQGMEELQTKLSELYK